MYHLSIKICVRPPTGCHVEVTNMRKVKCETFVFLSEMLLDSLKFPPIPDSKAISFSTLFCGCTRTAVAAVRPPSVEIMCAGGLVGR